MSLLMDLKLPYGIKELDYSEIDVLAEEVRKMMIDVVSKNGGHLAPSLGVVELTIALLRAFDPMKDRIVWDVGHQSYAYKILTDRRDNFSTLRQFKGISGFIKPVESRYDAFGVGHSSTSIAAASGIKASDGIFQKERHVIAVIGDGSISSGLAFEGLNNLGNMDKNLIVILNDNEMCIHSSVGGMSSYLCRVMSGELYTKFRRDLKHFLQHAPMGSSFLHFAKKMEEGFKAFFTPGVLFEELGFKYFGPIDGHDIKILEKTLHNACLQDGPVLIHIGTKKGKGYKYAEENPSKYHSISSFNVETGKTLKFGGKTYSEVLGSTLCELAKNNDNIVAISAAMTDAVGLGKFAEDFGDRFFDVGIAEQYAATFSAGLAISGCKPYVVAYSTFLQRAFDQIIHDIALQNLPVTFCVDRCGLVGDDGPTHHGVFDISYFRLIPGVVIMAPKDDFELESMLKLSAHITVSPAMIRYPRGGVNSYPEIGKTDVVIGEPEIIDRGGNLAIISIGHIFSEAYKLYKMLCEEQSEVTLINLRFVKPINKRMLIDSLKDKALVVTIEENSIKGGAGEEIQSILMDEGITAKIIKFGVPDRFIEHGSVKELRRLIGLTAEQMLEKVNNLCQKTG